MVNYDKDLIKSQLTEQQVFTIFEEFGAEPILQNNCIIGRTICHNPRGEGSFKLYYYFNSHMCHCYTGGCDESSFDIFELVIKVKRNQENIDYNLYDAVKWIVNRFHFSGELIDNSKKENKEDWNCFKKYDEINEIEYNKTKIILPEYDSKILERFNYDIKIKPWIDEGISEEVLKIAKIGYYPGGNQITIPHYDKDNRFIGLRGRTLSKNEMELFGKYRPIKVNQVLYNHPLSANLYGLNLSKNNIKTLEKAIVLEGEKSVLQYLTYVGKDANISVACCGSNLSNYQVDLLLEAGAKEIIVAFDRQFENLNTDESKIWIKKLTSLHKKYHNEVNISFIFDKNKITPYKASPTDCGLDVFMKLYKERIIL